MPIVTRHSMTTVVVLVLASLLIIGIFVWSGIYNIGADDKHSRPVYSMLQMIRERSITVRANRLHPPPNLNDADLVRQGAGNYNAMCTGCHLAPGMTGTELSRGLYPAPPNLATAEVGDAAHHFWVIKHGIKASGMPAWGPSMDDEYIWGMVAFLQQLPTMDAAQYQALVDSSGGHSHGGGETQPHGHDDGMADDHGDMSMDGATRDAARPHAHAPGTPADHHDTAAGTAPTSRIPPVMVEHRHADGTVESHPVTPPAPADDGHDHQH